MGQQNCKEGEV